MKPKHQIWKNEITIRRRMEWKWMVKVWCHLAAQHPAARPFSVQTSLGHLIICRWSNSQYSSIFGNGNIFFSGPKKLQVYSPRFPDNMLDKLSWLQLTGYLIGQSGPLLWLPIIYITLISSYKKVSSRFGNSNKVSTLKTMITKAIKYLDPSASFALRPCSAEESYIKIWCGLPSWLD